MASTLSITAAKVYPALLDLPWNLPLEQWPDDIIVALPKGISRHTVRFVRLQGRVIAIKETSSELAHGEYRMLRKLRKIDVPVVSAIAVLTGRVDDSGEPLPSVLVTRHLKFSMPYRAVFSQLLTAETATRLVDALALLLVKLHLAGFYWGDVSLSNTLFRRDAGAFAAYLVDAETGKLYPDGISTGNRENDLEIARVNIAGELMDLLAGERLDESIDPVEVGDRIVAQYRMLWDELNGVERFGSDERWRINQRVSRLNDLGFDIEEMSIKTEDDGTTVRIQPKVVDAGHHHRRLIRLTGMDVEENQARRLLNDFDEFRATLGDLGRDEEQAAHTWLSTRFEPVIAAIPRDLRGKLEPAQMFHELLEHRWYMSQNESRYVPFMEAVSSYITKVLPGRRDEEALLSPTTMTVPITLPHRHTEDDEAVDWRDTV